MSPEVVYTKPLLDKLGVKPGMRVAVVGVGNAPFLAALRERTAGIVRGKPRGLCDMVFLGVNRRADLEMLKEARHWIEPNGAIWVVRLKGGRAEVGEMDVLNAGPAAGLVDNKIASFSDTQSAMRFVIRLRDRPR